MKGIQVSFVMTGSVRKRNLLVLFALILILIVVIVSAVNLLNNTKAEADNNGIASNSYETIATYNIAHTDENDMVQAVTTNDNIINRYIFVGDSRYVGMQKFAQSNDVFIAENGKGYDFLVANLDKIRQYADKNSVLIIGLGVNDYGVNYRNYIKTMNEIADSMECNVYYMLINPVEEEKEIPYGYTVYNEMIDKYNMLMQAGFNDRVKVIDSNSYLKENGFSTMDGLHYDDNTYNKIYNYLKSNAL